jgi:hypothetical protein
VTRLQLQRDVGEREDAAESPRDVLYRQERHRIRGMI